MTKPLRLYGWELDNPTPKDISPVYTDTATLSRGLPLYDNYAHSIKEWIGDIDINNNTFNLLEKRPYVYNTSGGDLYLYEIDLGTEKHYYIKEDDEYIEVTNSVTVYEGLTLGWESKYSHKTTRPYTSRYSWDYAFVSYTNDYSELFSLDYAGYPYKIPGHTLTSTAYSIQYLKDIPNYGINNTYSSTRAVNKGEDTSAYIDNCILYFEIPPNQNVYYCTSGSNGKAIASEGTWRYLYFLPKILVRVKNRTLRYNNHTYLVEKYYPNVNTLYTAFIGTITNNVYYYKNVIVHSFLIDHYCTFNENGVTRASYLLFDRVEDCVYTLWQNADDTINEGFVEKAVRAPNLDTDILPWEA